MKRTIFLLSLIVSIFTSIYADGVIPYARTGNLLKNGSFEYGLHTNWEYKLITGSEATFNLEQNTNVKDGTVALRVDVNSVSRANNNSIGASTRVTVGNDSIYLLRFWACGPEDSKLYVDIDGCVNSGILYELHTGQTVFQFPFKVDPKRQDRQLTISFYFRDDITRERTYITQKDENENEQVLECSVSSYRGVSYYIDGVEVLDSRNKQGHDVYNTYIWNYNRRNNAEGKTWSAGDNDVSLQLPDGRTIWFFNDSFYGKNHPELNRFHEGGDFVRNIVLVQDQNDMFTTYPVTNQGGQRVFFRIPDSDVIYKDDGGVENCFWVGNALIENDTIKVHLIEVYGEDRAYLGKFTYPELKFVGIEQQAEFCHKYETFFVEGNTIYLYKTEDVKRINDEGKEEDTFERHMHAAKTKLGNLNGKKEPWEYWDGANWTTDRNRSARILDLMGDAVIKIGEGNYAHVSMPVLSPDVKVSFAPAPQGPWTGKHTVITGDLSDKHWYYMPNFHKQLPNGNYSVSFSANYGYCLFFCRDCQQQSYTDKFWYRQRYIEVDLLGMSPYTKNKKDCAGIENGTAYFDECGECVGGTTGKAPCINSIAKLYTSPDYTGNVTGLDVGEYLFADLAALGFDTQSPASVKLTDGYIASLFEEDSFTGNMRTIESETAHIESNIKSIIIRRKGIENLSGIYSIQNKHSELYMGVTGAQANPLVVQVPYTEEDSQHFELQYTGNGYYKIINQLGKKLLNVVNMGKTSKANLELWGRQEYDITLLNGSVSDQYNNSSFNEGVSGIIDKSTSTKYRTSYDQAWVQYQSPASCVITKYSLTSVVGSDRLGDPRNWTLYGSNNGTDWTALDTRTNISFSRQIEERSFTFTNELTFSHYRIDMSCTTGQNLQVAEWKLFVRGEYGQEFDSQKFIVQDAGNGYVRIINKNSDMPVEVLDGLTDEGVRLWQSEDQQQTGALWKLTKIGGSSIEEVKDNLHFVINPNPVKETINIEMLDDSATNQIVISDLNGRILYNQSHTGAKISIPVSHWAKGVYLVKVYTNDGICGQKIVKL